MGNAKPRAIAFDAQRADRHAVHLCAMAHHVNAIDVEHTQHGQTITVVYGACEPFGSVLERELADVRERCVGRTTIVTRRV